MTDKQAQDKKIIDSAVARVSGAVQVAGATVAEAMDIKDEAMNSVKELNKKQSRRLRKN
jgi:hypothetical protein